MSNLNTILNKLGKIEEIHETNLGKHEIELALAEDLKKAENNFKSILLEFGNLKEKYQAAKIKLEKDGDSAYELANKYLTSARELGLNPMENPIFKAIDAHLMSDIWRNRNK